VNFRPTHDTHNGDGNRAGFMISSLARSGCGCASATGDRNAGAGIRSLLLAAVLAVSAGAIAADPATVSAGVYALQTARPAVSKTDGLVRALASLPVEAARVLYLPLGVIECIGAPLPGVGFMSGARHVGTGILAPFRLVGAVLTLPVTAAETVEAVATAVPRAVTGD